MRIPYVLKSGITTHLPESFSTAGFWSIVRKLSKRGGHKVMGGALTLYYCLRDPETPAWAKSIIVGALGYLIFPMDLIPDAILGAGFTDDWSVIVGALASVMAHIKEEHKSRASAVADRLLGDGPDTVDVGSVPVRDISIE